MTIDERGWLDWTVHANGIRDKVYSEPNQGLGIVCHSIEGSLQSAYSRFLSTERDASGNYTPNAQASVMFCNPKVGALIQMYPVTASTWTSGNRKANTTLWAVESEGRAGEPLNANQVGNMVRLGREWERHTGKNATRSEPRTVWQHNEVWNWATPNAGPTACPSDRYQPFFDVLEDNSMDDERWRRLLWRLSAGSERGAISDAERDAIAEAWLADAETAQSTHDLAASADEIATTTRGLSDDKVKAIVADALERVVANLRAG